MEQNRLLEPDSERLASLIESVLLVAGEPVTIAGLATAVDAPKPSVIQGLSLLTTRLNGGIRVQEHRGYVQLVTAPENAEAVHRFLGTAKPPALSRAALESLTVIAYRQPATRAEIELARGANSDRAVQTLLARNLIEECGRRETLGRPMQYATTFEFLEYFGLSSLRDLPPQPNEGDAALTDFSLGVRFSQLELAQNSETGNQEKT